MGRSPFDFQSGVTQWRMAPINGPALQGDDVFTLGYDGPVPFVSDIAFGDYFETSQTLSLSNVAVVRCRVSIKQPDTMPNWEDVSKDFQLIGESGGDPGNKIVIARGVTEADINRTIQVSGCTNSGNNTSIKIVGIKDSVTAYVNKTVVTEGPRSTISAIMVGARWKFSLLVEDGGAPIERAKVIQNARESGFYRTDMSMHVSKLSGNHTVYFRITLVDFDQRSEAELAFAPATGMTLWLKADAGVTTSGSDVTTWADQSGNHFDAVDTIFPSIRKPQFVANALNGLPGLAGTQGADAQGLAYNTSNLFATGAPRTIFVVATFGGTSTFSQKGGIFFSFRKNSPSWSIGMESPFTFGLEVNAQRPFTYEQSPVNSIYVTTPVDYSHQSKLFRYQTDIAGTHIQPYDNGVAIPMQTTVIPATTESGLSLGYIVGCLIEDNGADVFEGMIHEIIVYSGVLSAPDALQTEVYLREKWGL